jgi:hypothetical protein
MTKKKGRAGWYQATPKDSKYTRYFTVITSRIKAVIVTLALWLWFLMCLAKRIGYREGGHDD